ncbi:MAG: MogA/MoaB family molybdenum cofactor biosynthesis protein [Firmicutes bacterium]|nr:MogA/MoaB family molybdenum cofactor biosynthesis protein [Bacillota bacterium]
MDYTVRVAVITASDSGYKGERATDISGDVICDMCKEAGMEIAHRVMLPDDRKMLADEMARICDEGIADLVLTTGGTGFSPRDWTPEATTDIAERMVNGIPAAMVYNSLKITPRAMLTRAVSAIRKKTLIVNLPGSPKAVKENLEFILPSLGHGLEMLLDLSHDCANTASSSSKS